MRIKFESVKKHDNKKGASIVYVLILLTILGVLALGYGILSGLSAQTTKNQIEYQQAYVKAKSITQTLIEETNKGLDNSEFGEEIKKLSINGGSSVFDLYDSSNNQNGENIFLTVETPVVIDSQTNEKKAGVDVKVVVPFSKSKGSTEKPQVELGFKTNVKIIQEGTGSGSGDVILGTNKLVEVENVWFKYGRLDDKKYKKDKKYKHYYIVNVNNQNNPKEKIRSRIYYADSSGELYEEATYDYIKNNREYKDKDGKYHSGNFICDNNGNCWVWVDKNNGGGKSGRKIKYISGAGSSNVSIILGGSGVNYYEK